MAARARVGFQDTMPPRARVESLERMEREGLVGSTEAQTLKSIAKIMVATNVLFMVFLVIVITIATVAATNIADSVRDIAETLSPATVASMVHTMENTLTSGFRSAKNLEHLTGSSQEMGSYMLSALNETVHLIETANTFGERLLTHPNIRMSLGADA